MAKLYMTKFNVAEAFGNVAGIDFHSLSINQVVTLNFWIHFKPPYILFIVR